MTRTTFITARTDEKTRKDLDKICKEENLPQSHLLHRALLLWVKRYKRTGRI